jgi:O-succinylbenzoic acid--CoA ligase
MSWAHKEFQLNNRSFSNAAELVAYAEHISPALHTFLTDWFSTEDVIIVQTSGSTGTPKPIPLKKEYMKNSALATGDFFQVKEKTKALCCLPIEFIAGKMMVVRGLILGWHLDVVEPSSNPLENGHQPYDFAAMVPLQLSNSLDKVELIDQLIVGGGVVSHQLEKAIQGLSTKIYATYGMTETITHIAVKPLNLSSQGSMTKRFYQTLPNVSITQDKRNCLVINAPKISDEPVITNDVVEILSPIEFQWKGRFDNVINSGGVKLHPEDIEQKLLPYISNRFFIAGLPDEQLGEKLVLVVEGEKNAVISNNVRNLKNKFSKFEIPKDILFVPKFKETATGKIQRIKTLKLILG